MAKTRQQKEATIQSLSAEMKTAKSAVFANFQGLKMTEIDELRGKCREQGVRYVASKKTLVERAMKEAGLEVDAKSFEGGVAVFFGNQDEVAPAQIVANFARTREHMKIFGGVLEGHFIDGAKVTALSTLPSKEQLLGQLVGTLNAPISGFVNVLAGNLRGLANVLNAIKEAKA